MRRSDPIPAQSAGLQPLSDEQCWALLTTQQVGRLALADEQGPIVVPINYRLDGCDIVFRIDVGGALDGALQSAEAAFEVDWLDEESRAGWSVLVRGPARAIEDPFELERLRRLRLLPWAPGPRSRYIRLSGRRVSGRRITPPDPAGLWLG